MNHRAFILISALVFAASSSPCQNSLPAQPAEEKEARHLFWIIPNFRASATMTDYHPLTASQKFKLAGQDSWDWGTVAPSAVIAGEGLLANSNRSFGQGGAGYARYLGASYGDLVIGHYMTEGVFPSILHQDPRYFRRGTGSGWSRLRYSVAQTFVTHADSGKIQPNYSEWLGSSATVAISNGYHADNRTAADAASKLGVQIGFDAVSNILKEFSPDIQRKFRRKHPLD